jgi:hypothetical protein
MCDHNPQCPPADAPDHVAAHTRASHPEQGWSLLCNGVVVFDDAGELLPAYCAAEAEPAWLPTSRLSERQGGRSATNPVHQKQPSSQPRRAGLTHAVGSSAAPVLVTAPDRRAG